MRIIWISNLALAGTDSDSSGSWLFAMKNTIENDIELINVTDKQYIYEPQKCKSGNFMEYYLPVFDVNNKRSVEQTKRFLYNIISEIEPDIIHIWGLEKPWSTLIAQSEINIPILLEIQGIQFSLTSVYCGAIRLSEIIGSLKLSDILHPFSIPQIQKYFVEYKSKKEFEEIQKYMYIGCPSKWAEHQIYTEIVNSHKVYNSLIPLRKAFYTCSNWRCPKHQNNEKKLTYISSYHVAFKGLHILLKALAIVLKYDKYVRLNIVGPKLEANNPKHCTVYERYILNLIKNLDLSDNVSFTGRQNADKLIEILHNTDIFVNPSFVESFSVATAESLYLGVPSILAFSGAMPEFSEKEINALYYNAHDYKQLGGLIIELLEDRELCNTLSERSQKALSKKFSVDAIRKRQLGIYTDVVEAFASVK